MTHGDTLHQEHSWKDWNAIDWIMFTTPLGIGHILQRIYLGHWGSPGSMQELKLYAMLQAAQYAAYGAVGYAIGGRAMSLGHLRHVVAGQVLTKYAESRAGPPMGSLAAVQLLFPNLGMMAVVHGHRLSGFSGSTAPM